MKDKVKQSLRELRENVADHEAESSFSAVTVDLGDLKRLLRWAHNNSHVWFEGDRVTRTDARVPFNWLDCGMQGTVLEDSGDDGTAMVTWDDDPEEGRRIKMYHNEIKLVKL